MMILASGIRYWDYATARYYHVSNFAPNQFFRAPHRTPFFKKTIWVSNMRQNRPKMSLTSRDVSSHRVLAASGAFSYHRARGIKVNFANATNISDVRRPESLPSFLDSRAF